MSSIVCHVKTGQFPCSDNNRQVTLPMSKKQDDKINSSMVLYMKILNT